MQDSLPNGGRFQTFYQLINDALVEAYEPQCHLEPVLIPPGATPDQAARVLRGLLRMLTDVEIYGKVFRTLRVASWDDKKEEEGKKGEGSVVKSKSKLKKEARRAAKLQMKKNGREPEKGQVYLVTNRWMKEAWPYD